MKHEEVFEQLTPPAGGLDRLRERLDERPRAWLRFAPPAVAFAVALAAAALLFFPGEAPDPVLRADTAEVEVGRLPMPTAAVSLVGEQRATAALSEVKTANPDVAFYWVSSTGWRGP